MKLARIALFSALALAAVAFAADKMTPDQVVKDAEKHDGKKVTVTGTVQAFRERTSRAGNDYTTFRVKGSEESVNIYMQGKIEKDKPKNGDTVEVTGRFVKEKKVGEQTFKNEVDISKRLNKEFGVKVTKKAADEDGQ